MTLEIDRGRQFFLSNEAKEVLRLAEDGARRFSHDYVGVEHLLLGLSRQEDTVAMRVLTSFGIGIENISASIESIIGAGNGPSPETLTLTPRARVAVDVAINYRRRTAYSEHLLLGVLTYDDSMAAGVLQVLNVDVVKLKEEVTKLCKV